MEQTAAHPPPEVKTRSRLTPRHGYFSVQRADLARIRELGESDETRVSVPVLVAVWVALCDIGNEQRSNCFKVSVGIIRHRAGVSRRTAFDALKVLEGRLGMLSRETNRSPEQGKFFDQNTWTIHQSRKPLGNKRTGNKRTSASKQAKELHKGVNNSVFQTEEKKKKEEAVPLVALAPLAPATEPALPSSDLPEFCTWKQ